MTREAILTQLRELITLNFEIPADMVTPEASWRGNLGMDSLDLVDMTFFIKRHFGVDEKAHAYRGLATVGDVVEFIHERVQANPEEEA